MREKPGDLIFLTRRTGKNPLYRWFVSNAIAVLTKFKNQKTVDVKVHSAIIFELHSKLYVRDMGPKGNVPILLTDYKELHKGRIEIIHMPKIGSVSTIARFNREASSRYVTYDYWNTFVWQVVRALSHKWIGTNTPYKRMCAEDAQRMYNLIRVTFFKVEQTNPNELYAIVQTLIPSK